MWNRYVAIGDSITEGWGDRTYGYDNIGWVPIFSKYLEDKNSDLVYHNYGWRGATVNEVLNTQVNLALSHDPDLITVTVGANDALTPYWDPIEFKEEYSNLLKRISTENRTIILMTYSSLSSMQNDLNKVLGTNGWNMYFQRISDVNEIIKEVAAEFGYMVVDMESFKPFQKRENMSSDLVHPNSKGYKLAAEFIIDRVQNQYSI